jgi:hypothetical protein
MSKSDYESLLNRLILDWIESGRPEQESFDWSKGRERWNHEFPKYKKHISELPDQLDRNFVRKVFEMEIDVISKFLTSMIWGYGDRGYGPYRVSKMLEQRNCKQILGQVLEFGSTGKPLEAYKFLEQNRIRNLGPSFSSKFIYFSTPREVGAPIFDSYIAKWIKYLEIESFANLSVTSERWNFKAYSEYWRWTREISSRYGILPDELELVIFRASETLFSKNSPWERK